jgi:membrane-bound lytic murein transglycosylase MltF
MCARIAIFLLSLAALAIGSVSPTLGQGVTSQRFVLPTTRAWTGDLSAMLKRGKLRLLVPYSKTLFFLDRGRQMGVVAEFGRALEASINARYKSKTSRFHVDLRPTARDRLLEALNKGYGDARRRQFDDHSRASGRRRLRRSLAEERQGDYRHRSLLAQARKDRRSRGARYPCA